MSTLGEKDLHFFSEGTHTRLYEHLGAHLVKEGRASGVRFSVWAPNAASVSVVGDWCHWDPDGGPALERVESSGIWSAFVPGIAAGTAYKFHIRSQFHDYRVNKTDPFGFLHEEPPRTASIVSTLDYAWGDGDWMAARADKSALDAPISIYEVHLGSWRRGDGNEPLSYREVAPLLVEHVKSMGFTHVEFLPLTEHPFYGSWGYQVTGYFAPTARYGSPQDLMYLIDLLHQHGIGVILDWVPAHFPSDEHGLGYFDGTHLFEHADPRSGFHPDWNTLIYNYDRHEVRSFLLSSAHFWLDRYHIDGIRVDGVASMLYLDYSRKAGEWIPNEHGGRENLGAIRFLREFNESIYRDHPGVQTIAEESTAWPMVSRPTYLGGLGFGFKWDMGWMHDTLEYFKLEPIHRQHHQDMLTFRGVYAYHENFMLPLSHDEVVHGKRSLLHRMPGDEWQRFANLRLLYGYMFATPGKKLTFMGGEFAQRREWNHDQSIDWHLTDEGAHRGVMELMRALNDLYRRYPSLHELDVDPSGLEWLHTEDRANSVLVFARHARERREQMIVACNFTPVPRSHYRLGVDSEGSWKRLLSTDESRFGGSGYQHPERAECTPVRWHGRPLSIHLGLPPLSINFWLSIPPPA